MFGQHVLFATTGAVQSTDLKWPRTPQNDSELPCWCLLFSIHGNEDTPPIWPMSVAAVDTEVPSPFQIHFLFHTTILLETHHVRSQNFSPDIPENRLQISLKDSFEASWIQTRRWDFQADLFHLRWWRQLRSTYFHGHGKTAMELSDGGNLSRLRLEPGEFETAKMNKIIWKMLNRICFSMFLWGP